MRRIKQALTAGAAAIALAVAAPSCGSERNAVTTPSRLQAPAAVVSSPGIPPATRAAQPLPSGSPGTPAGRLPRSSEVNWRDPSAVSAAAVTVMYTMDTKIDTSQYQAELRAAPFLTPSYLSQLRAAPPVAAPGAQWNTWAAHRAYTTVRLIAEHTDQPAGTRTAAYRQWGVTVIPIGRDHWSGPPVTATVFVTLTRAGGRWLVSAVAVAS